MVALASEAGARSWAKKRGAFLIANGKEKPAEQTEAAPSVPTFEAFQSRFVTEYGEANQQKPSSIEAKKYALARHLVPFFGPMRLNEITTAKVQEFKATIADRHAKTVSGILSVLSILLKTAVDWEVIGEMPCRIRRPKFSLPAVEFFEPEQFEALLVRAAQEVDERAHLVALLGGEAGLRLGEILALERGDVDYRRGVLRIERSERKGHVTLPKSGKGREVPTTRRLLAALKQAQHMRGPRVLWREAEAFGNRRTKKKPTAVNRNDLVRWMKQAQKKAGLEANGKIHILRHTYGARLATAGAAPMSIKELMGHQDLETTLRYLHLAKGAKDAAVALLEVGGGLEAKPRSGDARSAV